MEPTDDAELKRFEERKRDAMVDPAERWRLLQEMIAWADSQRPVPRNSPAGARAAERAQLARMKEKSDKGSADVAPPDAGA